MKKKIKFGSRIALFLMMLVFTSSVLFGCSDTADTMDTDSEISASIEEDTADEADETEEADDAEEDVQDSDTAEESTGEEDAEAGDYVTYTFRNSNLLESHYEKHGIDMGFDSAEEYEEAASDVVNNPDALHKTEEEDGDDIYYVEDTNEFVVVSTDGYIRTYFLPDAGKSYYDRQ